MEQKKNSKTKLGVIGVCAAAVIGGGVLFANSGGEAETSSTPTSSIVQTTESHATTSATEEAENILNVAALTRTREFDKLVEVIEPCDYETDFSGAIGRTVTFEGKPNATKSSSTELVFYSRKPVYEISVPVTGYEGSGMVTIRGTIESMDELRMTLTDCEILSQEQPAEPAVTTATTTAPPVTTATTVYDPIVYVSNTGKYHNKPDCSGMEEYTEMTKSEAKAAGHSACGRCY